MTALMAYLLANWQTVAKIAGVVAVAGVIWWYGFHIPAVSDERQKRIVTLEGQLENAAQVLTLLEQIQKGQVKVDARTFQQISSIRAAVKVGNPHTVLIPSGRLLPGGAMRPASSAK